MPKDRHLTQLPVKSFKVAPGDVIGGFVYVMDKPLGIEEGMVGISVDSPGYRNFIKNQMVALQAEHDAPSSLNLTPLQACYNKIRQENPDFANLAEDKQIDFLMAHQNHVKKRHGASLKEMQKVFFSFGKYHELKGLQSYYVNEGMGGLLFEQYKKECKVEPGDHFAAHIKKLCDNNNQAYMIKQDGELVMGGTGPGTQKILKTNTGKKLQRLANPFVVLATGGLSGIAFGVALALWRRHYIKNNSTTSVNSDAIVESLSTKLAAIRGMDVQGIDTIQGTYQNGAPKVVTAVSWRPGCLDLSNKLAGGSNFDSVIVSWDGKSKLPHKVALIDGVEYTIRATGKDKNDKPTGFEKISPEGKVSPATRKEYEKGHYVSNDNIRGLGESLLSFLAMADNDGMGKVGQNKAIIPIDPPDGNYTQQFFGIDFGKAYKGPNPIVGTLKDDFSFDNPQDFRKRFVNYSALYDNPLREKMKGVYLLAALRGKLDDDEKAKIIDEYRKSNDHAFADKLQAHPKDGVKNGDLELIETQIAEYYKLAAENPKQKKEYEEYAKRLTGILKIANDTDESILKTFEKRMHLTPTQIDLLDNLEKLTANNAHTLSPDGTVKLNHIRVENGDRIPWQLNKNDDGTFDLVCEDDNRQLNVIRDRLKKAPEILAQLTEENGKFCAKNLTTDQVNQLSQQINEEKVANARGLAYRTQETRNNFHERLRQADKPKEDKPKKGKAKQPDVVPKAFDEEPSVGPSVEPSLPQPERSRSMTSQFGLNSSVPSSQIEQALTAEGNLKKVQHFLAKEENKAALNISGPIQPTKIGSFNPQDAVVVPLKNAKTDTQVKAYVSTTSTNDLQYSVQKDCTEKDFYFAAKALCRIAIQNAKPNAIFDFSMAPPEKKEAISKAFESVKKEELSKPHSRFDEQTFPKLIDTPKVKAENQVSVQRR
ncbi:hypothetical protein [Candidatus Berkiella aquae]|uniref:Uncharacterized protein n=1 Tax=Candidatus Berkiella aquae TaxID=295108 RepID=A0A0Q9YLX8_9GAMM|nr:hypothetical protein [Candidatus Berkiella aquae]MCS5710557.1 hypothetical protein [Candidatus Berkiella aquae]